MSRKLIQGGTPVKEADIHSLSHDYCIIAASDMSICLKMKILVIMQIVGTIRNVEYILEIRRIL